MNETETFERCIRRKYAYTHYGHAYGDLCGDDLHWVLTIKNDIIVDAKYIVKACSLTTAIADYMAEHIIGMPVDKARTLDPFSFIDFEINTGRKDCVTLPKEALDAALHF